VMKGDVEVTTNSGESKVTTGHTLHVSAADADHVSIEKNATPDEFDQWAADRDRLIAQDTSQESQYMGQGAADDYDYGMADLSTYGYWDDLDGYGYCWQPFGVPLAWTPFGIGSWNYFGGLGWTWISYEPWGWLPYHRGRWIYAPGHGWMWQPGAGPGWNPAPVTWLAAGNQIAWAPRGAVNAQGKPLAQGIVTGTMMSNTIRPDAHTALTRDQIAALTPSQAPAPASVVRTAQRFTGSGTGTIQYDPSTGTYVNSQAFYAPGAGATVPRNHLVITPQDAARASQPGEPIRQDSARPPQPTITPQPHVTPAPHYAPPPAPHFSAPAAPHFSAPAHFGGGHR
jgi:hypothetical protein